MYGTTEQGEKNSFFIDEIGKVFRAFRVEER